LTKPNHVLIYEMVTMFDKLEDKLLSFLEGIYWQIWH